MKRKIFSILFALVLVVSFSLVAAVPVAERVEASPGATLSVSKWTEYAENPVFAGIKRAYYPCMLVIGGTYHMWYTDRDGDSYQVGYTTSADGISWDTPTAVTTLTGTPGHQFVVNVGTEASPHYRIWYADAAVWPYDPDLFRTAESTDGLVWTNDQPIGQDNALVRVDDPGDPAYQWVYGSYGPGTVLYNPEGYDSLNEEDPMGNKYVMYYDQYTRYGETGVNEVTMLAISVNGINWKRYGNEPVLEPAGGETAWDAQYAYIWTVLKVGDSYHAWYSGGIEGSNDGIGYAYSADGLTWVKEPNSLLHVGDANAPAWRTKRTYTPRVIKEGDGYKMWFTGVSKADAYTIGYATADGPFPSIQSAINAASPNDIINVAAGTYNENVVIGKSVTLQGDGSYPTIHDNGVRPIGIQAGTSSVTIKGFTIVHAATGGAIMLVNSDNHISNLTIEDNKFTQVNGAAGIWIEQGTFDGVTIKDNVMSGLSDTGVMIMASMTRLNFEGNTITGTETCTKGLYVQLLTGTALSDNTIHDNTITGFTHVDWPQGRGIEGSNNDYVTVSGNRLNGNYDGISWWVVSDISITNNEISDNGRFGICIKGQNLQMTGNTLQNNGDSGINVAEYSIPTQDVDIHFNNLVGNAEFGIRADGTDGDVPSETVDATYNWWGKAAGPYHATTNPGVIANMGDAVSDNVVFSPWLYKTQESIVPPTKEPAYAQSVVLDNYGEYGWNTFSAPIYLDGTADTWAKLITLTELDYSIAYRFDLADQDFVLLTDASDVTPGEGFFIKMNAPGSLPILYSTAQNLTPPTRTLTVDWNLIGLASLSDLTVDNAFGSIATAPGLAGYGQVVSPSGNVNPGAVLADGTLHVGEAYWVYMLGARTLAGSTTTPVNWVSP